MNCTHKVLILGHSFVRRLNVFLHQSRDRRTVPGFDLSSVDLSFLGVGGRTVPKTLQFDIAKVKALQPEIIILELGSNDLCSVGRHPESVGSDIEHLVSFLHDHCGAAFVVACQVIHRSNTSTHIPDYNVKVDVLNQYLQVVLEPLVYADFWYHRGLRNPSIPVLCRDGVHLNDHGNYTLYRSYRGAILFALKQISGGEGRVAV